MKEKNKRENMGMGIGSILCGLNGANKSKLGILLLQKPKDDV